MKAAARQHGFSLMEVMVAVVVLAVCALPMAEAIRNGLMASTVGADKARELRCMKSTMETVLAAPYQTLWDAAVKDNGASYALLDDASCAGIGRSLSITLQEFSGSQPKAPASDKRESALLHITATSSQGYIFTTMVAR